MLKQQIFIDRVQQEKNIFGLCLTMSCKTDLSSFTITTRTMCEQIKSRVVGILQYASD